MQAHSPPCQPRLIASSCLIAAAFIAAAVAVAHAAPVRTAHVEAELVPERSALVPGEPLTVALRLAMDRGWHTYWQNPGDSGLPTTLAWKLPAGMSAGPMQWPAPQALPVGPLLNYGYEGEVLLLTEHRDHRRHRPRAVGHAARARRLAGVQGDLHSRKAPI